MSEGELQIQSFRVVFDLERRIHRVDRFRVPLPYGLPLRSVAYALACFLAILLLERLPLAGALLGVLPAPARLALLPVAGSYLLTQLRVDGRTAHSAIAAWLRFHFAPRDLVAFRAGRPNPIAAFGDVLLAPDGEGPVLRRGLLRGPCTVTFASPGRTRARRSWRTTSWPAGAELDLGPGEVVQVR